MRLGDWLGVVAGGFSFGATPTASTGMNSRRTPPWKKPSLIGLAGFSIGGSTAAPATGECEDENPGDFEP